MYKERTRRNAGRLVFACLLAFLIVATPGKSRSLELGLTPNHVYGVWLGINESLLAYGSIISNDKSDQDSLRMMKQANFQDKVPADVYGLAEKISARLKGYIFIDSEVPDWLIEYAKIEAKVSTNVDEKTPSAVFLISTQILNAIVDVVVENTGWEQPVSVFYTTKTPVGKSPSDVFALADLALRRVDVITAAYQIKHAN